MRRATIILGLCLAACQPSQPASDVKVTTDAKPGAAEYGSRGIRVAPDPARDVRGQCSFYAWSKDEDPKGLNVRAGPSAAAAIVGVLPPPVHNREEDVTRSTEFRVVEAKNGWFRIVDAQLFDGPDGPALPSGWIHGRYIEFALETGKVFANPDPSSPVLVRDWKDSDKPGYVYPFPFRLVSDCQGRWVKLLATAETGEEREGWTRGICGLQETTCAGAGGDYDH